MLTEIETYLSSREIDIVGVAPAANWPSPHPECRPKEILKECQRVIIFGKEIPYPIYLVEKHAYDLYAVSSHNFYHDLDAAAIAVATRLTRAGYPSIPIGSYQPAIMRQGKYWGMISLKHAAVRAGLGSMGKNSLFVHASFGNRLRLGGILTTAKLPAGKPLEKSFCPDGCRKCVRTCPVQALDGNGEINQYRCLKNCAVHPLISLSFITEWFKRYRFTNRISEMLTKTMVSSYTYSCFNCLVNCPNFKRGIPVKDSKTKSDT
jgi:epoxyqueuosine reductase QueG